MSARSHRPLEGYPPKPSTFHEWGFRVEGSWDGCWGSNVSALDPTGLSKGRPPSPKPFAIWSLGFRGWVLGVLQGRSGGIAR